MNPVLEWMLNDSWRRLSMLSSTCQRVATLQFVSCADKDSLCVEESWWLEFHIILDQCHGVRSHGTSSSQGWPWRKRIVCTVYSLWLCKQCLKIRPRPAQWLFSNETTWKDRCTQCSNECWMKVGEGWVCWVQLANMWQHCSLSAVQRNTAFVEESWCLEFHIILDQCHGVRSHGTSSSQGWPWRKRIVVQSTV